MSAPPQPACSNGSSAAGHYCTSHFVTGSYAPVVSFLDDVAYARCLDTLVKACCDMLITHKGKVFLGKRQVFPQKDWWYGCGGRMKPGESMFDAARRLLLRELKLDLSVAALQARLQTVGSYSFLWGKREQLPQTNGTADISTVVTIDLTDAEAAALQAHEFGEASQWVAPEEVLDVSRDYHAALQRSMSDYIKLKRFQQLDALLLGGVVAAVPAHPAAGAAQTLPAGTEAAKLSDAELLEQVRAFFRYQRQISANDTQTIQCPETQ